MHPLPPITVERIRAQLARRGDRGHGSATLVSLLAYAGLRPQEALALTWRDVRDRTLLIERALAFGEGKRTKTHARRTVPLVAPLAQDLAELRLAAGRPADRALLRPRGRAGVAGPRLAKLAQAGPRPAAMLAGVANPRPYDLRHSYVSLLIHEGLSIVEVARRAGHSPQTCLDTYSHVFDDFAPERRVDSEAVIRATRDELVRVRFAGDEAMR